MSALLQYQELQKTLKNKPLLSIYVLYGIEEWYVEEAAKAIAQAALIGVDDTLWSFNKSVLDARETSVARIVQELTTPPFMAERKLVQIHNCPYFAPRVGRGKSASAEISDEQSDEWGDLGRVMASMPPGVVLLCQASAVNLRLKLSALAKKNGALYDFSFGKRADAVRDAHIAIQQEGKRLGVVIDPKAAAELINLIGVDEKTPHVRQLYQETAKLAAHKGYKGTITLQDVVLLTSRSAEAKAFQFTDSFTQRQLSATLGHLRQLWLDGEEPFLVLAMLARHLRLLLVAREMLDSGAGHEEIVPVLGGHPFVAGKIVDGARYFSPSALCEATLACLDIDAKGKSGRVNVALALELLVVKILS